MKTIYIVDNCHNCKLVDYVFGFGFIGCHIDESIEVENEMPKDAVHEKCPLKSGEITFTLSNEPNPLHRY